MNKKLKKMAIVGATVIMTATSVGFSNAMQVEKVDTTKLTGKTYVCVKGKRYKLNLKCMSLLDTLKWLNKNYCSNKFPSIDKDNDIDKDFTVDADENDNIEDNNQNNGNIEDNNQNDGNNQNGNLENGNQGNDKDENQGESDNNQGNNNQGGNIEDSNQNNNSNSTVTSDFSKEQVEVLNLVNKERKANGLKPLTLNKELSNVANIKSRDMIEKGYFDHTSPTYGSPFDMMKKFNISYNTAGENIAMGQKTPSEVMNSWMNSSGHRANILNSTYTELGVGIQKDSNGTIYWTQMFIGR